MAPRLNWSTELRKIIFDALDYYHLHAYKRENGLQKLREVNFIHLPKSIEDSDDKVAETIYQELKELVIHFFDKAFGGFEETKNEFLKTRVERHIEWGLVSIHGLADKLAFGEISWDLFVRECKNTFKDLRRLILKDYNKLFKNYREGCYYLINHLENISLNLTGYLSIYYAFRSIPDDLWKKREDGYFIRLYERHKIESKPIQLLFCECLFKGIDFFSGNYSYLDIFEHSKSLKLDKDSFYEIREYIRTGKKQLLDSIISRIVTKICSEEDFFKGKGGLLTSFFKQFIHTLKRIYSTQSGEPINVSVDELDELYNFLVLQNGILEYEVFKVAANSGYACLPKISIIINEESSREEKETDLLIVEDNRLSLVEITFRRNIEECQEKLDNIVNRLEKSVGGYRFEKRIVTRDDFRDFISSLSNSLHLPIL